MSFNTRSPLTISEIHLAGETAPAGQYREITSGRIVILIENEVLPATLDGHVGEYVRLEHTWEQRVCDHSSRVSDHDEVDDGLTDDS